MTATAPPRTGDRLEPTDAAAERWAWIRAAPTLGAAAGAVTVVVGMAIGLRALSDNSYLTHLATGRIILAGGVPHTDPYSFTAHGDPWTVESWLAEAVMALVERLGGGHALQLLNGFVTALLTAAIWRLTRRAQSVLARLIAVAHALVIGGEAWSPRPLLWALLFLAGIVLMAEEDRWSPSLVVLLMWVWVNVHGSFVLGPGYLALRLAGRALDRRPLGRLPSLLGWSLGGTALGALNPVGAHLLLFPFVVVTRRSALALISEYHHPAITGVPALAVLVAGLIALGGAARRRSFEDALPVLVFCVAGFVAVRNLPDASIVTVPAVAGALQMLASPRGGIRLARAALAAAALAGGFVGISAMRSPAYDLSSYPVAEVTWAQTHGLLGGRLIAPDFVGNYLEYRYGAGHRVFIDDRYDMYPPHVLLDYDALVHGRPGWDAVLDRYRAGAILWPRRATLTGELTRDPSWRVVLSDSKWIVAVRSGAAPA